LFAERKVKKSILIVSSMILLVSFRVQSQTVEPLKLIQTIPLPGLRDGDFDHLQVDLEGQRLFLAAEDNSAVEVVDLRTNALVHTITGLKAPHSLAYNAALKKLFVVDGEAAEVKIYDGTSFKYLGAVPMQANCDSSIYDPATKYMYVVNGGKHAGEAYSLISIVDTTSDKKLGDIKIDGDNVQAMALEKSGPRLFANMYSRNAVAVIDRNKQTVIATWSIAQEGHANGPMALDEAGHRLFVVARYPGKIIVLDTDSGRIITTIPCVGQYFSDDAVYDTASKRLYVAGVPFLNVFQIRDGDRSYLLGQVPTAFHAVTAILIPQLSRYCVAVNHHGNTDAAVQIYEVVP
jgi:DNA-binding beta-propeller fold protein YncE